MGKPKTQSAPKVSIAFTSYNHAPYLRQAIDSVLDQTFSDWELLIWDDISDDGSWEIIQSYDDPRIKPIRNDRKRRYIYAINETISSHGAGQYIAIHHSDDAWAPNKLERQVAHMDATPNTAAAFTHVQIIDEDNNNLDIDWFNGPALNRHEWLRALFFNQNKLCHPSVMLRKSALDSAGLYKLMHAQTDDAEMWTRLLLKHDIDVIPEKLTLHRVSASGATVSSASPQNTMRQQFEWFQQKKNYAGLSVDELLEIFPEAKQWLAKSGPSDAGYMLAMIAMDLGNSNNTALFGLDLLYQRLNDPQAAEIISTNHGFDYLDFMELTARQKLFHYDDAPGPLPSLRAKIGARTPPWIRNRLRPILRRIGP